jgi:hypothetical protein
MIQQIMVLSHVLTTCAQLQILQVNRQQQETVKIIRMASMAAILEQTPLDFSR